MTTPTTPTTPTTVNPPTGTTSRYLTAERLAIQETARRFALAEVLPVANELDRQKVDIPEALMRRLAALGYFCILIDREHGGLGYGVFEYALITEELARAWMSVASIIARGNGLGTQVADPQRRAELLRRSARGDWVGAAAFSEPGAGSDLANVQCRAERDGDDYLLSGDKRWCGNAKNAAFIVLLARTEQPAPGEHRGRGIQSFLIEKTPGTFPPGMTGTPIDKIGYHGISSYAHTHERVRVPAANLLRSGRGGNGEKHRSSRAFSATLNGLAVARVHTAARAIGLARGALEDALTYAQERVQFDRPLASFQAIRFMLANMATQVAAARALSYEVAQQVDDGGLIDQPTSMVKLFATEMAERVTSLGLQIHGGNGYTTERAVERYWRDARLTTIFEGTSEIQRKIISDRLLGKGGD